LSTDAAAQALIPDAPIIDPQDVTVGQAPARFAGLDVSEEELRQFLYHGKYLSDFSVCIHRSATGWIDSAD
jgi:hypothetical protein